MGAKNTRKRAGGAFGAAFRRRLTSVKEQPEYGSWANLAKACGVPASQMTEWSLGYQLPGMDSLRRIGERLDLSLDWLLWGIGPQGRDRTRDKRELESELLLEVQKRLRKKGVVSSTVDRINPAKLIDNTVAAVQRELEDLSWYERVQTVIQGAQFLIADKAPEEEKLLLELQALGDVILRKALRRSLEPSSLGLVVAHIKESADPRNVF